MHCYFHFEKSWQILFNIQGQKISGSAIPHLSLGCLRTKLGIGAREHDLKEVWVIQLTIFIWVEKLNDEIEFCFWNFHLSIFSHEVYQIHWCNETIFVSIDSTECTIGLKIYVRAQKLSKDFKLLFLFSDAQQNWLECFCRLVWKYLRTIRLLISCISCSSTTCRTCHFKRLK